MNATPSTAQQATTGERAELISSLERHRGFLLQTAEGLTEEQARTTSTVSALTIASLLKHVADTEEQWFRFAVEGAGAFAGPYDDVDWAAVEADPDSFVDTRFVVSDEETLDVLRARIEQVAARTEEILRSADLDAAHELPVAPWFEPGVSWSVRRVALHMLAEISQHSGHADIIREAVDGQKTMG
ncbi:DinB family protein [Pseudonocardia sp. C8]|uniref:DinB family protein n=1 Tax=Pseudonocardia sp. C8 TaxID=2762759 RepID=UPI001642D57C|nr:DinB family protein [Pseudonocardia sp. C8]MBC3190648.1 DinB family protein [Pseudonocardia sp. C8]